MTIVKNIRNIGIFAHVDAGKTTLTENILYKCGNIKVIGRVDEGTAHTDSMEVERARGISVGAAEASVSWKGMQINITTIWRKAIFHFLRRFGLTLV